MNLSTFWIVTFVIIGVYYLYIIYAIVSGKSPSEKKHRKNNDKLHINDIFANKAYSEQDDLDAILNQVEESEKNSKLLEAFKLGSNSANNNSLTHKKDETFKIIRNSTDKEDSEMET